MRHTFTLLTALLFALLTASHSAGAPAKHPNIVVILADLKRAQEFDNTFILFLSDNGACPYDRRSKGPELEPYDPQSSWKDSTGWAWARNTPFRYYKQNQFEGGIATPAIVHWPAGLKTQPGSLVHTPAHLVDVLPTVAEICGAANARKRTRAAGPRSTP